MGTECHRLLQTPNLAQAECLGMLHTSAQALCALQIPNIAWALNANQILHWFPALCCAIRNVPSHHPLNANANTKGMQTLRSLTLTIENWSCCSQTSSCASLNAHRKEQLLQVLRTPELVAPSADTASVTNPPQVSPSNYGEGSSAWRLPALWFSLTRVRGVLPVSWGATAMQQCQQCGVCRCAQGLLFHFHLSHPISTAVCHQRREN